MVREGDYFIHCHKFYGKWIWRVKNAHEIVLASSKSSFETEEMGIEDARQWLRDNHKLTAH